MIKISKSIKQKTVIHFASTLFTLCWSQLSYVQMTASTKTNISFLPPVWPDESKKESPEMKPTEIIIKINT
jgi:hypothetical protein